ncbi:hypothetical protein [Botrimarina sp.]|uniref:hypothetical protein n=1 Tax=Botrimarina sp. TaxID=2795802 RepID=UPI0032EFAD13
MLRLTVTAAATAALAACCNAGQPCFLCDPVVTYTNGMRLASTEACRSHNVYWRCDPGHIGYCGGRMSGPLHNDLRSLGTRPWGVYVPPPTPRGPVGNADFGGPEGLEDAHSESLGSIALAAGLERQPLDAAPRRGAPPAAAPLPPRPEAGGEGDWLNAIQTIGRQMMATPEG